MNFHLFLHDQLIIYDSLPLPKFLIQGKEERKGSKNKLIKTILTKVHSEPSQTSKMEFFGKLIDGFQPFSIFARSFIIDVSMYI